TATSWRIASVFGSSPRRSWVAANKPGRHMKAYAHRSCYQRCRENISWQFGWRPMPRSAPVRLERAQVDSFIGQRRLRQPCTGANQLLTCAQFGLSLKLWIPTSIEPKRRLQHALREVEGQEPPTFVAATKHDALPTLGVADIFEF